MRFCVFEPFVVAARQIGVPVERYMELSKLPLSCLERSDPDELLPELPGWEFLNRISRAEGVDTFGIVGGGTIPHSEFSSLMPLIAASANLNDLLHRFIASVSQVSATAAYALRPAGSHVWFVDTGSRLLEEEAQARLFQVLGMIQLVQIAAGKDWRPEETRFSFPRVRAVEQADELNPSRILFSQSCCAIRFPRALLSLPIRLGPITRPALAPIPPSFGVQLAGMLEPYFGDRRVSKEMTADLLGLSPRTLQRRLEQEGSSFAQVIERVRMEKAKALIESGEMKMIDVSMALGYENAPSFTRAFRRWTGISPREYRRASARETA